MLRKLMPRFFKPRHFALRDGKNNLSIREYSLECTDNSDVTTRIALPEDCDRVVDFMRKTYFKSEPSLVNIGLACCEEPPAQLVHLMREQIKEGTTIIAHTSDNCLVAAAINAGSCPWDPERMTAFADSCCLPGPTRDIIKFYAHVTREPNLWAKFCVLKIFECCYLGVDPEHLEMGIGSRLVEESWYLARDCGYELFRIDCTSSYTAKIAESFGWEKVFSLPYRRYVDCGGLVFKHIQAPHTEVRVFADLLQHCKDYCYTNPEDCKIGSAPKAK